MKKQNNTILWVLGIIIIGVLVGTIYEKTPSITIYPSLPDSGGEIYYPSEFPFFLFTTSGCGDMSDAGCGDGWEPQCFVNDCDNCGVFYTGSPPDYSNPFCSTCYFCVRTGSAPEIPTCPDHAPYYCDALEGCISTQPEMLRKCDCYKKFCVSSCSSKTLNYKGICVLGGTCEYETVGVECCSDTDCGGSLVCKGYSCLKDEPGQNLGFEFWTTDFSPQYWDVGTSSYMFVQKAEGTIGSYSLGLIMPSTESTFGVDIFGCLYTEVSQDIDLTDIDELKYDCTGTYGWSCESPDIPTFQEGGDYPLRYKTYIDSTGYSMKTGLNTINVRSYTGIHKVKFYTSLCYEGSEDSGRIGTEGWETKIDNIQLIGSDYALLEALLQEKIELLMKLEGELVKQSQLISDLDIELETKINLVKSLTDNIDEQLILISALELNLDEKIQLVNSLELNIQEQAITILALTSQAEEQAIIISNLNLNIQQQAQLISEMELTAFQQAIIIDDLNLNIQQQAQIIDNLNINLQQKIELISQLEITTQEQLDLIGQMTLSFTEQQEIIDSLSRIISEDVNYILELELSVVQSADYINSLELTVSQQSDLISQLELTNQEQTNLISQLELNNEETAQLISNLDLQISDQALIIDGLNLELLDDAEIISNLNLKLSEEAHLIDELHLTINEQIELISQLELSMAEEKELISQLHLTIEEQQRILDGLRETKFDFYKVLYKIGDFEIELWMLGIIGVLLLLLLMTGGGKR